MLRRSLIIAALTLESLLVLAAAKTKHTAPPPVVPPRVVTIPAALFGIEIGKPFPLPQCEVHQDYPIPSNRPPAGSDSCGVKPYSAFDDAIEIHFAHGWPPYLGGPVKAYLQDGLVTRVEFETRGIVAQEELLELLSQKFGRPTQQDATPVNTEVGATYNVLTASWRFADDSVLKLLGASGTIRSGLVQLDSHSQQLRDLEKDRARAAEQPRL